MGKMKIEIDDSLVEKARRLAGARSKREAVDIAPAPLRRPRTGWIKAFRAMAARRDDVLLDETRPTRWDDEEWQGSRGNSRRGNA